MSMNFNTKIRTGKLNILVIHERKFVLCTNNPVQHLRILFIFLQFLHHRSSEVKLFQAQLRPGIGNFLLKNGLGEELKNRNFPPRV